MTSSTLADGHGTSGEQSPLLGKAKIKGNGITNRQEEQEEDEPSDNEIDDDIPLVEPTTKELLKVLSSILLGSFLGALDSTIIATLSAPIAASFHSLSLLSWLASAYFIANAALQPISGKLTDIFSRRTGLIFSNVFFGVGNLICGLAQSESVMIFGRVVAGMGGGGLTAISTFVISDLVPLRRRGLWQGVANLSFGAGAGLGGVFGGWINDTYSWRWAFLLQVPVTILSGTLVFFLVHIPVKKTSESKIKRIDFLGATTLVITLILLLLGLNSGGNVVPWLSPLVLTTLPLSGIFLLIFIYVESNVATEPIIPVRLLLDRTVASACLTNWFITMAYFGLIFYAPIYFQVQGMSTTAAGVRMIPQSVGTAIGSIGCGFIMRWLGRYYWLNVLSMIIFTISLGLISTWTLDTPNWVPFIDLFLGGLGYAGMLTITLLALISAVDHKHQATITSASYAFRSTGSTIGITIASSIFQNILKSELWGRLGNRKGAADIIPRARDSLDAIKRLPVEWRQDVMDIYMDALRGVFLSMLGLAVMGFVVSLFMREHKLHSNLARRGSQNSVS